MARLADPDLADRRRRQILDAAIACFRRRGFHQATMQEICAEAGISAGALYRYFASKAEIIAAIAEDHRGENDVAFLRAAEKLGLVEAMCVHAREFFGKLEHGDGAVMCDIFAECIRDHALADALRGADARSLSVFVTAIEAAQLRGEVDAALEPEIVANTLFAAIEGIGLRRAFLRDTDPEAAVSQFRALTARYLSPRL